MPDSSQNLINISLLPKPQSSTEYSVLIYFQLCFTLINTFLSSSNDSYHEITDTLDLDTDFHSLSLPALITAITVGIFLSLSQGKCYQAQSRFFSAANPPEKAITPSKERYIKFLSATHYLAEVNSDMQPIISLLKQGQVHLSPWQWGLTYTALALYTLLGDFLELMTTYVALEKDAGNKNIAELSHHPVLHIMQFIKNLSTTFLNTIYTLGSFVGDFFPGASGVLNIAWQGYAVSLPIAAAFALCESLAHDAESDSILDMDDSLTDQLEAQPTHTAPLTVKEDAIVAGHYLSDIIEGMTPPLALANKLGGKGLALGSKLGLYASLGLYSALGSAQEMQNTRAALKQTKKTAVDNVILSLKK